MHHPSTQIKLFGKCKILQAFINFKLQKLQLQKHLDFLKINQIKQDKVLLIPKWLFKPADGAQQST